MARWGVDVIGMTGVPEAVLARELSLCYAEVLTDDQPLPSCSCAGSLIVVGK